MSCGLLPGLLLEEALPGGPFPGGHVSCPSSSELRRTERKHSFSERELLLWTETEQKQDACVTDRVLKDC